MICLLLIKNKIKNAHTRLVEGGGALLSDALS